MCRVIYMYMGVVQVLPTHHAPSLHCKHTIGNIPLCQNTDCRIWNFSIETTQNAQKDPLINSISERFWHQHCDDEPSRDDGSTGYPWGPWAREGTWRRAWTWSSWVELVNPHPENTQGRVPSQTAARYKGFVSQLNGSCWNRQNSLIGVISFHFISLIAMLTRDSYEEITPGWLSCSQMYTINTISTYQRCAAHQGPKWDA